MSELRAGFLLEAVLLSCTPSPPAKACKVRRNKGLALDLKIWPLTFPGGRVSSQSQQERAKIAIMISVASSLRARIFFGLGLSSLLAVSVGVMPAQQDTHGRKYTPPPATTHIVVSVQKAFNGKPMENVAVIFHATKNGKDTGNMEVKTNTQGDATMDFIEAGSHVTVQVFANGYSTFADEFDVTDADKLMTVKLKRPQAQISMYQDNDGKASTTQPGIQERAKPSAGPTNAPPIMQTDPAPPAQPGVTPKP